MEANENLKVKPEKTEVFKPEPMSQNFDETKVGEEAFHTKMFTDSQSSNVREISYYPRLKNLEIVFKGGSRYEYFDVPQETFDNALKAESIGKFFADKIKRVYQYRQMK